MRDLLDRYGRVHIINLLGQKERSAEFQLSQAFGDSVGELALADVQMMDFDFHQAVKGSQFENLNVMVHKLRDSIDGFGYSLYNHASKEIIMRQSGVFRVNCLDCLDR